MHTTIKPGLRKRIWFDNCGPVEVPITLTHEIEPTCFVTKIEIVNESDQLRTVEVRNASGRFLIPPRVIPAGEMLTYNASEKTGRRMTGGVYWKADGAGCYGFVAGFL